MPWRQFHLFLASFALLAWIALFASLPCAAAEKPPNILLILADDLGYSDLGCYGGEIDTPNIDALAADGVRMTQVYNSARCCPSRASLMTGLYPSQAGIGDFTSDRPNRSRGPGYLGRLNHQCATIAEVLKPAGYGCYYVGKWHMHPATGPIVRGFDEFYGYTDDHSHDQYDAEYYIRLPAGRAKEIAPPPDQFYATDVFNQYAMEFIKQGQQSQRPWFLFLGHSSPHFPVQAPAERADKYDAIYQRGWDVLRQERFERMQRIGLIDGDAWNLTPRSIVPVDRDDIANNYSGQNNPAWDSLSSERKRDLARRMAVFAAMVETVDSGVGQIVDHLKQSGDFDNTLILFLSDNGACYEWGPFGFDGRSRDGATTLHAGPALAQIGQRGTHHSYGSAWANLGNTPFRMYKHFTHEGGISTPFIAHWPAGLGKPNRWVRQAAHVMDVMPTLIEAAGASYPVTLGSHEITPLEGTSLIPAFKGQALPARILGFDHQAAHALRDGDWKAVYSKRMPDELKWELYNLAEDRCELNNLADQHPDRLKAMVEQWQQWAKRVQVIWEPSKQADKQTSTELDTDNDSPLIAKRPLQIEAVVSADAPHGVVLAQGGNQHGYALHFIHGKAAWDVRVSGKLTRVMSRKKVHGTVRLKATLSETDLNLWVDGEQDDHVTSSSPGLIPEQPLDGLNIGFDGKSAAGDYSSPNPFNGKIDSYQVKASSPSGAPKPSGSETNSD